MLTEINVYAHKAQILKQIQSNKAKRYRRINTINNVVAVIVTPFLTFLGFMGADKIRINLGLVDTSRVDFIFNLLVFALFVLVTLHLVFGFTKLQSAAEAAVVALSGLINEIEDIIVKGRRVNQLSGFELDLVRHKYTTLTNVLPANSDREYLKARKDFKKKEIDKLALDVAPWDIFNREEQRRIVEYLVKHSQVFEILRLVRSVDERLYIGGGLIRNLVWDYLHGYEAPTQFEDIDIVYFDLLNRTKEHDTQIEQKLAGVRRNVRWQVKNQARMHEKNNDSEYASLEDALMKWPEICTVSAVRLDGNENVDLLTP